MLRVHGIGYEVTPGLNGRGYGFAYLQQRFDNNDFNILRIFIRSGTPADKGVVGDGHTVLVGGDVIGLNRQLYIKMVFCPITINRIGDITEVKFNIARKGVVSGVGKRDYADPRGADLMALQGQAGRDIIVDFNIR